MTHEFELEPVGLGVEDEFHQDLLAEYREAWPQNVHRPPGFLNRVADAIEHVGVSIAVFAWNVADAVRGRP